MMNHVARLFSAAESTTQEAEESFEPSITNTPDLPAINWGAIGKQAPVAIATTGSELPAADAVVITWAEPEWAALEHVFCTSNAAMPYSSRNNGSWPGWQKYSESMPAYTPTADDDDEKWTYWGEYRLVQMGASKVLLFKSNTHLTWPGERYLADLIQRIISVVKPKLILSAGTAGGARVADHIGTVNTVRAGTLYETGKPETEWPDYSNNWEAGWTVVSLPGFQQLLFPIPTVQSDLESLANQFNAYYKTNFTLAQLDPDGLNFGDAQPALNNMTPAGTPLLTAQSFVVATTDGNLDEFACVEMDDAIIAETCAAANIAFGFVRNISDPAQNSAITPAKMQGHWGEAVYSAYGFYTSYNGAIATWAILDAQL